MIFATVLKMALLLLISNPYFLKDHLPGAKLLHIAAKKAYELTEFLNAKFKLFLN